MRYPVSGALDDPQGTSHGQRSDRRVTRKTGRFVSSQWRPESGRHFVCSTGLGVLFPLRGALARDLLFWRRRKNNKERNDAMKVNKTTKKTKTTDAEIKEEP